MQNHKKTFNLKLFILIILLMTTAAVFAIQRSHVARHVYVVRINPKEVNIYPVMANGKHTRSESFAEMIERLKPYAAINGTFYDENMRPLGDIMVDNKLINRGRYPNALAVRRDGSVGIVRRARGKTPWPGCKAVLAAGPRLLHYGKIKLDPIADGFTIKSLSIVAARSGAGITKDGKLLLVVQTDPVKLAEFAQTMRDRGAVEAINLDGGPACGLHHRGKTIIEPGLRMTNLLVVYNKKR